MKKNNMRTLVISIAAGTVTLGIVAAIVLGSTFAKASVSSTDTKEAAEQEAQMKEEAEVESAVEKMADKLIEEHYIIVNAKKDAVKEANKEEKKKEKKADKKADKKAEKKADKKDDKKDDKKEKEEKKEDHLNNNVVAPDFGKENKIDKKIKTHKFDKKEPVFYVGAEDLPERGGNESPEKPIEIETETEAAPETESTPETEAEPETEATPETEAAPETEATPETEAEPETEATPETEAAPETEAVPETESTPVVEAAPVAEEVAEEAPVAPAEKKVEFLYVKSVDGLEIHKTDSKDSEILDTLKMGDKVEVVKKIENSKWIEIKFKNTTAFVEKAMLSETPVAPIA